jgi:hypothetical protein
MKLGSRTDIVDLRLDGRVELVCPTHACGHPSLAAQAALGRTVGEHDGVHGCCGCCQTPWFTRVERKVLKQIAALTARREREQ